MLQRIIWKLSPYLVRLYNRYFYQSTPNIKGDRKIEWSWIVANLPEKPGKALDLGCGDNSIALTAARKGFKTIAIDLIPVSQLCLHPNLKFIQKDIFDFSFPPQTFP